MRVSHMVGFAAPAEMVAEAERIRATYGITTFKVKVGRRPYRLDVEACRALRTAMARTPRSTSTATAAGAPASRPARSGRWTTST